MKRVIKLLILLLILFIPIIVNAEDDFTSLTQKYSKEEAIEKCITGDSDEYHCYRYTFIPSLFSPMYNTTVWTSKTLGCGFERVDEWDYNSCKSGALDITYKQCKDNVCKNISHSGYNGTPDFYDRSVNKTSDITCNNLRPFYTIYRMIITFAPILTLFFVTFDLVATIISGDAKKMSNLRKKLIRRLIALILLLVAPVLIHFLVNMIKNDAIKNVKYIKCVIIGNSGENSTTKNKELEPQEDPNKKKDKSNNNNDNKKTNNNNNTKAYGPSKGSKEINISGVGKFVVIDTKYPGGLVSYHKRLLKNDITQEKLKKYSNVKCAGGCCLGVAQLHACGLAKGKEITVSNVTKGYSKKLKKDDKPCNYSLCNNSNIKGCSGTVKYEKDKDKYIEKIYKSIRQGHPVIIVVTGSKTKDCGNYNYTRHFITVVGYKADTDMKFENLLLLDSYTGSLKQASKTSRKLPSSKYKICNYPKNRKKGYYYSVIK